MWQAEWRCVQQAVTVDDSVNDSWDATQIDSRVINYKGSLCPLKTSGEWMA